MRLSSLLIGGNELSDRALMDQTQVERGLNGEIGRLSLFLLGYPNPWSSEFSEDFGPGFLTARCRQEVVARGSDGSIIFGGFVQSVGPQLYAAEVPGYAIACQDYTVLLETAIITPTSFAAATDQQIIRTLFAAWLPEIDTSEVQRVEDIPSFVVQAGDTLRSVLDKLRELSGAHWYVTGDKRLRYFAEGAIAAPFDLDEDSDPLTGTDLATLFGDEDAIFGEGDVLFGGGVAEDAPASQWLREGMRYTEEWSAPANRVRVIGEQIQDTTALVSQQTTLDEDDGYVGRRQSLTWPPALGAPQSYVNEDTITAHAEETFYSESGFDYYARSSIMVRFDMSFLPPGAVIEGASLQAWLFPVVNDFSPLPQIGIEYIDPTVWPISAGDYDEDPQDDAYAFADASTTGDYTLNTFVLRDVAANLPLSGFAAFRIHFRMTSAPTALNRLSMLTHETTDATQRPKLSVSYRVVGNKVDATYEDSESIATYGVVGRVLIDEQIKTNDVALLRARQEVLRDGNPAITGALALFRDGLDIGQRVPIRCPSLNFEAEHIITRHSMQWVTQSVVLHGIEFGKYRPGQAQLMVRISRALKQIGAMT